MSASEFAFLAVGLVLGVASGAALIEVLRARPPGPREVRVTVAPNAIQSRLSSTLADAGAARDVNGLASGGPGDRRWRDELDATGEPATTGRRATFRGRTSSADGAVAPPIGTPVRMSPGETRPSGREQPAPLWPNPTSGSSNLVAVPMSLEPDPITTELRASAAASAVAAMRSSSGTTVTADRPTASAADSIAAWGGGAGRPTGSASGTGSGAGATTPDRPSSTDGGDVAATPSASASADGRCVEERRVADERCAVATRAREGSETAHSTLRQAQRTHDELIARGEAAAASADPRSVRAAKEAAQRTFREARNAARSRDDLEAGARDWLADINRINRSTREAMLTAERDRAGASAVAVDLERIALEADAARISAERADEACLAAREAVAACDEARLLDEAAAAHEAPPQVETRVEVAAASADAAATEFDVATPMASRSGQDAPILRILRGDRDAMHQAVARLAGDDPAARRLWQTRLGGLAEALIARSIEATSFEFPSDHPFWGLFNQVQNRDIAAALASLGFRFDGFGDWVDERLPTQRELAMAVGYAGQDPMRVRHWPTEAETRDLLRDVRVAADEYVAGAAGDLSLGEIVTLLGRRADALTELWNEWGTVRQILLEAG